MKKIILLSILLFTACQQDYNPNEQLALDTTKKEQNSKNSTDLNSTNKSASFSEVLTILNSKCLGCHGTSGDFTLGDNYEHLSQSEQYNNVVNLVDTSDVESSRLLQKMTKTISHGGGEVIAKNSNDYNLIYAWIKDGAIEVYTSTSDKNTSNSVVLPGYTKPSSQLNSFSVKHKDGAGIIQGKACITCHNDWEGEDIVAFGGTLFSYIHTPNGKYYKDLSGYTVELIKSDGSIISVITRVRSSSKGQNDFYAKTSKASLKDSDKFMIKIKDKNKKVINTSKTLHKASTQRDCNRCHSENGTNGAPGRILGAS